MNTTDYLIERKAVLEKEIRKLEAQLKKMPEDRLYCYRYQKGNSNYVTWYRQHTEKDKLIRNYIPKKNIREAKTLAKRTYKQRLLYDLQNELNSIHSYLKARRADYTSKMFEFDSPYRDLLYENSDWENEPYEKSTDYPEALIVPAPKGEMVRSKSEASIAQILFNHQIQYRYENIHVINGYPIASDFTILHPIDGREVIWEHFGRIDDPEYIDITTFKLNRYLKQGYIPGYNLILTFETKEHPLSIMAIEEIVKRHFLT